MQGAPATGLDNVLKGTATVVVLPEITDNSWYLLATTDSLKPIILLVRQEPRLVRKDADTDESVFWRKMYHYGVDARTRPMRPPSPRTRAIGPPGYSEIGRPAM